MFYRFSPAKKNTRNAAREKRSGTSLRPVRWQLRSFIFRHALTGKLVFYFGLLLLTAGACCLYLLGKGLYNLYQRPAPAWKDFQRLKSQAPLVSPEHLENYLDSLNKATQKDSLNQPHSNL
ncbi:hypothetical protein SAMN04487995_0382 [Dyadobacter koreensis]|uniref:Uncharacterized protein n=1 Tax=Dyadobacter koreensis TaxID=408657 RepID=A0A1H6Q7H7_9BACT|nr:hypothetical protein [Dyadobacter koreensis]SEI39749.1 hypothetical protein SAMN04487995_0382 [Dyadobacter koreensis]